MEKDETRRAAVLYQEDRSVQVSLFERKPYAVLQRPLEPVKRLG